MWRYCIEGGDGGKPVGVRPLIGLGRVCEGDGEAVVWYTGS